VEKEALVMGFSIAEAQFLIRFFRNLPGTKDYEPTDEEYEAAMERQRQEAQAMGPVTLTWGSPPDDY
jgi:hypothetical protein